MKKNTIYKCCDQDRIKSCENMVRIPTDSIGYIIPMCTNIHKCDHKKEIEINCDSHQYCECWFMRENHTFVKCTGTLRELRTQLEKLLEENKYGGWSHLRYFGADENDSIVLGLEYNLNKLDQLINLEMYSENKYHKL